MKATRLPSGSYRTQVVIGYDENGKRVVRSFTADTEWGALKLATEFMEAYALGIEIKNITVEQAFEQYIEARTNILSPSTIRGYRIIKTSRLQLIKDIKIKELRINDVQQAVNFDSKRLSRKSIKSAVSLLKSVLDVQNVDLNIKKIAIPQAKPKKRDIPAVEDVLRVVIGSEL